MYTTIDEHVDDVGDDVDDGDGDSDLCCLTIFLPMQFAPYPTQSHYRIRVRS
jgi:hypothetical protein